MKFCVSLTTIPSRIENINITIDSINKQTIKPDKIFLNLPTEFRRFKNNKFTDEYIKKVAYENLEITRCKDYGPGTKIMGSLKKIKDKYDFVILLDDDHIYHEKVLEIFLKNFKKKPLNYSFYLNKIFNIKMGQCADGFLINSKYLDQIEEFYLKNVEKNKNLFHDDDLWLALYLYFVKKTKIENLIEIFKNETKQKIVYKATENQNIDALHQTVHKSGFFLNRRKIQKIEYLKYFFIKKLTNRI